MKHGFLLSLLALTMIISVGCKSSQRLALKEHPVRRYLPPEVKDLYFGLPLADFQKSLRSVRTADQSAEFRRVLVEEREATRGPNLIVYYFDNEGDVPLYEIILAYPSEDERDAVAQELLGSPNYKGEEWRYDSGEDYTLWAWKFKNKLVLAAILPGTEWVGEE